MMRYCDGASVSGNNETTQPYKGSTLHWRGMRIREAIVADLMTKVRKTPSWPRSWANFSLFRAVFPQECMGQPASFGPT
jgi:hypothetical protein